LNTAPKDIYDRLWAKDQKITEMEAGGGITVEFTSTQYGKVLSWVLSFGSGASPVEPLELVELWKENTIELYGCINEGPRQFLMVYMCWPC
jgi:hypothetical protein